MKNVKIKYDQVLFLFVYLRQLDLSVHRCRLGSWTEFQSYYKNVIPPSKIIQYLKASFYLPDPELTPIISVSEKKTIEKIIIMLKANVFRRFHLTQDEILYYYNLLLTFDEMLNSDIEIYDADLVKLRMGVITYRANVLELIVPYNDLYKNMVVEHFLQNEIIKSAVEVNKFIPKDFFVK